MMIVPSTVFLFAHLCVLLPASIVAKEKHVRGVRTLQADDLPPVAPEVFALAISVSSRLNYSCYWTNATLIADGVSLSLHVYISRHWIHGSPSMKLLLPCALPIILVQCGGTVLLYTPQTTKTHWPKSVPLFLYLTILCITPRTEEHAWFKVLLPTPQCLSQKHCQISWMPSLEIIRLGLIS